MENEKKTQLVVNQTNYTIEQAREKLIQHEWNELNVIRDYLGIQQSPPVKKSLNQEIYTQLRNRLRSKAEPTESLLKPLL